GPAMRNGDAPPPKWGAMSVVVAGELGQGGSGPLLRGARAFSCPVLRARRADEAREQRVRPGRPGLELRMELAADEPGVIGKLDHVTRELDDRCLQTEADSEERQLVFSGPADRFEHAFHAPNAEPTRNQQPVVPGEQLAGSLLIGEAVGGRPLDLDAAIIRDAAMYQCFVDALVAVGQLGVFP